MSWINKHRQGLLMLTGEIKLGRTAIRLSPVSSTNEAGDERSAEQLCRCENQQKALPA
ncbi:hypothetical protein SynMITS9220_01149 [Synechococcus sp. MIT S9220]|nr:hypothetical protein SynMITS9220_01149 [Synechococcus sp. MIT S9220]